MPRLSLSLSLPLVFVALAACVPVAQDPADTCGANQWTGFIGAPVSELQVAGLPTSARIIRPGQAVTMDFNPARLNVELDARDRVVRVYCG